MKSEIKVITLQSEKNREGKYFFYKEKRFQTSGTTTRFKTKEIKKQYYDKIPYNRGWLSLLSKIPSNMFDYYKYD